jgi:hypothetical protein
MLDDAEAEGLPSLHLLVSSDARRETRDLAAAVSSFTISARAFPVRAC